MLGSELRLRGLEVDQVLGLPRGGVVVAAAVARLLQRPLEVILVRKIGHPLHREFAVGAIAEGGILRLDRSLVNPSPDVQSQLDAVLAEEQERLEHYQRIFHQPGFSRFAERVLIVDDGLATGSTTEASVDAARAKGASHVVIATPVASTNARDRLAPISDGFFALCVDPDFEAVGSYYDSFPQTTDDEVVALLREL